MMMITKNNIDRIKKKKRLILSPGQKTKHYYLVFMPIILTLIILIVEIEKNSLEFGFGLLIPVFISLILYLLLRQKLRFREYNVSATYDDLLNALNRAANELEWKIEVKHQDYFQCYRKDLLYDDIGDMITIVVCKNSFLINCISDPRRLSFPLISLTNKENRQVFIKHLKDVINHRPETKEYLIPENEWTVKRIITRLILYPFWLFVIIMSISMIFNPIWFKSIYAGFAGLIFGLGYIIIDIKLIIRKKKYDAHQ